jgi:hypothetical protein
MTDEPSCADMCRADRRRDRGNRMSGSGRYSTNDSGKASIPTSCFARLSSMLCTIVGVAVVQWTCARGSTTIEVPTSSYCTRPAEHDWTYSVAMPGGSCST